MLTEQACCVLCLIMFWLMQMEVGKCEDMFSPWDPKTRAALYHAVWPRLPTAALREALPDFAHKWMYDAGLRQHVARLGIGLGTCAVVVAWSRPVATPLFLVVFGVEVYCFFNKFNAHMHFTPLILAWGMWAVDRRARYRGLFLCCVCAHTYVSCGAWRWAKFAKVGGPGGIATVYGESLRGFLYSHTGLHQGLRKWLFSLPPSKMGALMYATTHLFEGWLWVVLVMIEARVAFGSPAQRAAARPYATLARRGLALAVVSFHTTNFFALGMFFGSMSFSVAVVLWCETAPEAYDAASPRSHAFAAVVLFCLFNAVYNTRDNFPFNANTLFSSPAHISIMCSTALMIRPNVSLSVLCLAPHEVAALREDENGLLSGRLDAWPKALVATLETNLGGWLEGGGSGGCRAISTFRDELYLASLAAGLLDDPANALNGPKRLAGYPGVADLALKTPRLRALIAEGQRDFNAREGHPFDVISRSDTLRIVLAEIRLDGATHRPTREDGIVRDIGTARSSAVYVSEIPPLA